jgi:hypothetical protein
MKTKMLVRKTKKMKKQVRKKEKWQVRANEKNTNGSKRKTFGNGPNF